MSKRIRQAAQLEKISRREALKQLGMIAGSLWLSGCSISTKQTPPPFPVTVAIGPKKHITIALLGATGMAGGYILREALAQGYGVRALARTPAKLDAVKDRISIIKGDARDLSTIQELLKGSDAVISAIGPVKTDSKAARGICTTATGNIIQAMQQLNIRRYIVVSGAAVDMPGDKRSLKGWLIQKLAQIGLYNAVRDKESEYELLQDSSAQWTLVRCPLIEPEPFRREAKASLDTPVSFNLRAGELARFIIDQIQSQKYIREGPFLGSL